MRRPWDFWKSLLCAQTFIYCLYLLYGKPTVYHITQEAGELRISRVVHVFLSRTIRRSHLEPRTIAVHMAIDHEWDGTGFGLDSCMPVSILLHFHLMQISVT